MKEINTILEDRHTMDLNEFVDILKYELDIKVPKQTIIDTVHYLEKRGFTIYKDANV